MNDDRLEAYKASLLDKRWNEAGFFLKKLFETASYEVLDGMDFGSARSQMLWLDALLCSGLCRTSRNVRRLFVKLARNAWAASGDGERRKLLCSAACLLDLEVVEPLRLESCVEYYNRLADGMGFAREEVFQAIFARTGQASGRSGQA